MEVLTIENIDKIVGSIVFGRKITNVEISYRFENEPNGSYVFSIEESNSYKNGFGSDCEVWLSRDNINNEGFELYFMGLHSVTETKIWPEDIKSLNRFIGRIETVLAHAKLFYDENE